MSNKAYQLPAVSDEAQEVDSEELVAESENDSLIKADIAAKKLSSQKSNFDFVGIAG